MAKFSGYQSQAQAQAQKWIPDTYTHEGGAGFTRTPQQELFIQAANEMAEDSFYETAAQRQARMQSNIRAVISQPDGWSFITSLVSWLRNDAGMRSVSIMVAAEAVAALYGNEAPGPVSARQLVASACLRADEPAEFLGYWLANHGRKIPAAVKRGIADAAVKSYTERNALKYDGQSRAVRMGDVIEMCHPKPSSPAQSSLFRFLVDKRHNREVFDLSVLPATRARFDLQELAPADRHAFMRKVLSGDPEAKQKFELAAAGQWEWAKSWLGE